jgi:hypothetical protein
MYRVVLKKTQYFPKGTSSTKRSLQRYLSQYMDEIQKGKLKNNGEKTTSSPSNPTPQPLMPDEQEGVLWTGGFLGMSKSPGNREKNKQKHWIKKTLKTWNQLLQHKTRRRNDGFRFVLSLSPESLQQITQTGLSPDQTLREIWRKTLKLYRQHHQWNTPENEIGWISGAHHDTNNTHLHILLFPTTLSGKPLRTNNQRGPNKENDLNNLIALTNIAAEIHWRENLPLALQSPLYTQLLSQTPDEEPPIPELNSFNIPNGILPQQKLQTPQEPTPPTAAAPTWNTSLLNPEQKIQTELETGKQTLLQSIKAETHPYPEIEILQNTITTFEVWREKKIQPWAAKKQLTNPNTLKSLHEKLPDETAALLSLKSLLPLIHSKKTKSLLVEILEGPTQGHALLALTTGLKEKPNPNETLQGLQKMAAIYEKAITEKTPKEKLASIHEEGNWAKKEKQQEALRTHQYTKLLRTIKKLQKQNIPTQNAAKILETLINGSQTLTNALQARHKEAHHATILLPNQTVTYHITPREWSLNETTNQFEPVPSQGKPWPPHLDPDLTYSILEKNPPNPYSRKTSIKTLGELLTDKPQKPGGNAQLSPLALFIKSKWLRKRKLAKVISKELEKTLEIELPPP